MPSNVSCFKYQIYFVSIFTNVVFVDGLLLGNLHLRQRRMSYWLGPIFQSSGGGD